MNMIEGLRELYTCGSKHSGYQLLASSLSNVLGDYENEIKSRYERERLEYVLQNIDIRNKTILDIGGNTGFFTFEMIENGAKKVDYYEGNSKHAEFVELSAKFINLEQKISINNSYFTFKINEYKNKYDVILLLNVLHHIGDDYGDPKTSMSKAKEIIIEQINGLSLITDTIVLQVGFNWKGNKEMCLFENGTKREMISFIQQGTREYWKMVKIGIGESVSEMIKYYDLNDKNINRIDELGEFLNRPIFIMESVR